MNLSDAERLELERLIPIARSRASKVGPMHAAWDAIIDAEALLKDHPAIIKDASVLIEMLRKYDASLHGQEN